MSELGLVGMEDFLTYSEHIRGQSLHTIQAYKTDLLSLSQWLIEQGLNDFTTGHRELRSFLVFCSKQNLSPRTINRRFSALRGYSRYWVQVRGRELTSLDKAIGLIKGLKPAKRLPEFFFIREMDEVLSSQTSESSDSSKTFLEIRDKTLFEVMYSTGCRVSEVSGMTCKGVDFSKGRIKVIGKGSKDRFVFLGNSAKRALALYLPLRNERLRMANINHDMLFINFKGNPLSVRGIQYLLEKRISNAGIQKHLSPHGIRHSFATHVMNNGADIRVVQELLGHKNLSTTQVYTHLNLSGLRETYRQAHPHGQRRERNSDGKN